MAFQTAFAGHDIPDRALDLFMLADSDVHWSSTPPASWKGNKRAPWGARAGGKAVCGRGRLVNAKRMNLLTADIAYALSHGGEWPWQISSTLVPHAPDALDLAHWRGVLASRFTVLDNVLCWRVDRGFTASGPQYPAGSRVTGLTMSGYRAPIVTTGGMTFLSTDVLHVLEHGRFPFEAQWD